MVLFINHLLNVIVHLRMKGLYMAFNFNYCVLTNGVTYQIKVKVKFICNSSLFFLGCNKTVA